jgi:hypothetical protein
MLFREIVIVYSENRTKCINIYFGQSVLLFNVKEIVHIATIVL